ncbi:MAG: hypothetical protein MRJ68_11785 [Nitrospira sp.]|nr:hypothetical protein [Nitrospira sp.]
MALRTLDRGLSVGEGAVTAPTLERRTCRPKDLAFRDGVEAHAPDGRADRDFIAVGYWMDRKDGGAVDANTRPCEQNHDLVVHGPQASLLRE